MAENFRWKIYENFEVEKRENWRNFEMQERKKNF
jgi:hypothetical protein